MQRLHVNYLRTLCLPKEMRSTPSIGTSYSKEGIHKALNTCNRICGKEQEELEAIPEEAKGEAMNYFNTYLYIWTCIKVCQPYFSEA